MLFHVYDEPKPEGYYSTQPVDLYRTLLDADWPMYLLLPMLLIGIIVLLMLAWHVHEIPTHKAQKKKMRQAELVSALTLLGLFQHWVWAVALFFAYMDWDQFEDSLARILKRAREQTAPAGGTAAAPAVAMADAPVPMAPADTEAPAIDPAEPAAPTMHESGEKPA